MMNITTKMPTRVSMVDYPSVTIPMATRCECCESLMPAGFAAAQVDGLLACTATCCASLDEGRLNAALKPLDEDAFDDHDDAVEIKDELDAKQNEIDELEEEIRRLNMKNEDLYRYWEQQREGKTKKIHAELYLVSKARSRALIGRPLSLAV